PAPWRRARARGWKAPQPVPDPETVRSWSRTDRCGPAWDRKGAADRAPGAGANNDRPGAGAPPSRRDRDSWRPRTGSGPGTWPASGRGKYARSPLPAARARPPARAGRTPATRPETARRDAPGILLPAGAAPRLRSARPPTRCGA